MERLPTIEVSAATDLDDEGSAATLHDIVVPQLRAILLDGELPAGARIPEAELCARFGVSRTPLREALKVMAAEGFVTLRPNRGAVVAPVDRGAVGPIFETKGALERLIGLLAAERASDADVAELDALHAALGAALQRDDHAAYTRLNFQFHQRLAQATGNPVLAQSYEALQHKIWRYRFAVNEVSDRLAESYHEHERIMIALRARTRLDLAERLEDHNRLTGEAMARALSRVSAAEAPQGRRRGARGRA
jgi:DNA-binding GntR family transcriptional regulator